MKNSRVVFTSLLVLLGLLPVACRAGTLAQFWHEGADKAADGNKPVQVAFANAHDPLEEYDLTILVDNSKSMEKIDCPPPGCRENIGMDIRARPNGCLTRWQWSAQELNNFQSKVMKPLKIIAFAAGANEAPTFNDLFRQNYPVGGTNTTAAVRKQIEEHLAAAKNPSAEHKPLLLVVLSDGVPDNQLTLRNTILSASKRINQESEMQIVFLQIGNDKHGSDLLNDLDFGLMRRHAKFDIVSTMSYELLLEKGINKALQELLIDKRNQKIAM